MPNRLPLQSALALVFAIPAAAFAAEPATRTFPDQRVRYTLPGPAWEWVDDNEPDRYVFTARKPGAYAVTLSAAGPAKPRPFDAQFVSDYERENYSDPTYKKRSSRLITFLGLPAYQAETAKPGGHTSVNRVFYANGLEYGLRVAGRSKAVENDPEFDAIVRGFEFTEPPVVVDPFAPTPEPDTDANTKLARQIGTTGTYLFFAAAVLVAMAARSRRKAAEKAAAEENARRG